MSEWFKQAFGEYYLQLYSHRDSAEAAQVVDLILTATGVPAGSLVLDAPCGAGRHLHAFRDRGLRAFGFDLSPHLLRAAHAERVEPGTYVRADLRALPFKAGQVDLLVNLFSSLGYFPTDEENQAVVSSLVSLVKPGGWVVVDFMNSDYIRRNLQRESHRVTAEALQVQDYRSIDGTPPRVNKKTIVTFPDGRELELKESVRLYSPAELQSVLEDSGVTVEHQFGSYSGEASGSNTSRIILMGRRN